MKRIASYGIGLLLLVGVSRIPASAQQPSSDSQNSAASTSLGDYARQVRKEPDGTKPKPKVFDNDNLPRQDKLSVVGTPSQPTEGTVTPPTANKESQPPAAAANETKPGTPDKSADASKPLDEATKDTAWKQWDDKIQSQQQQIDLLQRELDVLQREYQIRAAAMYADAGNRLRNSAEWDKQDSQYKQQIADKQKALDDARQKLDDIREQARKAGAPSSVREP